MPAASAITQAVWRTPSAAVKSMLGGSAVFPATNSSMAWLARIDEEHGPGLGIERLDVPHAVVFLVGPRQLVLADDALEVILATGGGHQPGLAVRAHDLAVEIEARAAGPAAARPGR